MKLLDSGLDSEFSREIPVSYRGSSTAHLHRVVPGEFIGIVYLFYKVRKVTLAGRIEEVPHGVAEFMIERSVELRTANKDLRLLGIVVYRHPVTYDARILDDALSTEIVHLMIECIIMQNISLPGVSADL